MAAWSQPHGDRTRGSFHGAKTQGALCKRFHALDTHPDRLLLTYAFTASGSAAQRHVDLPPNFDSGLTDGRSRQPVQ